VTWNKKMVLFPTKKTLKGKEDPCKVLRSFNNRQPKGKAQGPASRLTVWPKELSLKLLPGVPIECQPDPS